MVIRNSPTLVLGWEDLTKSAQNDIDDRSPFGIKLAIKDIKNKYFTQAVQKQIRLHTTVIFKYFGNGTLIKFVP